jgi:hypothetical protein
MQADGSASEDRVVVEGALPRDGTGRLLVPFRPGDLLRISAPFVETTVTSVSWSEAIPRWPWQRADPWPGDGAPDPVRSGRVGGGDGVGLARGRGGPLARACEGRAGPDPTPLRGWTTVRTRRSTTWPFQPWHTKVSGTRPGQVIRRQALTRMGKSCCGLVELVHQTPEMIPA